MLRIKDWDKIYENHRTRLLKDMRWVPVPNKMDGDGYTELVTHTNGAAHLGVWIAILQVASKVWPRGVLVRSDGTPHTATTLSRMSRLPVDIFDEAIPRLLTIQWLEDVQEQRGQVTVQSPPSDCAIAGQRLWNGMEWNGMEYKCPTEVGQADAPLLSQDFPRPLTKQEQQSAWFEIVWPKYWRHVNRGRALQVFRDKVADAATYQAVLAAVEAQTPMMMSRQESYRPHFSSWLNAQGWLDETIIRPNEADDLIERLKARGHE